MTPNARFHAIRTLPALVLLSAASTLSAAPATVDGNAVRFASDSEPGWGIGATTSINERPFVGVDDQEESLPYFSGQYGRFAIEGLDMSFKLTANDTQRLSLVATPRYYEVKEGFADDGELNGISTTKDTWFAGLGYNLNLSPVHVSAQALYDIGGESDGTELTLSVSSPFGKNNWLVIPAVGLTWQDESLVEHFYGVEEDETAVGRPQYGDEASLNHHISLTGMWTPHQNWRLLASIKEESLGDGITDSPIIEEDRVGSMLFGVVYQF